MFCTIRSISVYKYSNMRFSTQIITSLLYLFLVIFSCLSSLPACSFPFTPHFSTSSAHFSFVFLTPYLFLTQALSLRALTIFPRLHPPSCPSLPHFSSSYSHFLIHLQPFYHHHPFSSSSTKRVNIPMDQFVMGKSWPVLTSKGVR